MHRTRKALTMPTLSEAEQRPIAVGGAAVAWRTATR